MSNRIEFNYETYRRNPEGWHVTTRDNRPVIIAGYNAEAEPCHQVAFWTKSAGLDIVRTYSCDVNGRYCDYDTDNVDLFMQPK